MLSREQTDNAVFDKMAKRCKICVHWRNVFKTINNQKVFRRPIRDVQGFYDHCKFSNRVDKDIDHYELNHKVHNNSSPHDRNWHQADDTTMHGADEADFHIRRRTPSCGGFEILDFTPVHLTHLALGGMFPKVSDMHEHEVKKFINKIIHVKWAKMTKVNGIWKPMNQKFKMGFGNRLRYKMLATGLMDVVLKEVNDHPMKLRPFSPASVAVWPYLSDITKDFLRRRLVIGDNRALREAADNILSVDHAEHTEEYMNTGSFKGMVKIEDTWKPRKEVLHTDDITKYVVDDEENRLVEL